MSFALNDDAAIRRAVLGPDSTEPNDLENHVRRAVRVPERYAEAPAPGQMPGDPDAARSLARQQAREQTQRAAPRADALPTKATQHRPARPSRARADIRAALIAAIKGDNTE